VVKVTVGIDNRMNLQVKPLYQADNKLGIPPRINDNTFATLITGDNIAVDG
jgi:hypothetical protein